MEPPPASRIIGHSLCREEMMPYVHGSEVIPERGIDLLDRAPAVVRGVIHQDADRAEFACAVRDRRPERADVADVTRHEKGRAPQSGLELPPAVGVDIDERNLRALAGQLANEFGTQA
jgi:hypothetical protein